MIVSDSEFEAAFKCEYTIVTMRYTEQTNAKTDLPAGKAVDVALCWRQCIA